MEIYQVSNKMNKVNNVFENDNEVFYNKRFLM